MLIMTDWFTSIIVIGLVKIYSEPKFDSKFHQTFAGKT